MQTTFMTTHALRWAMRQSAALIRAKSLLRISALAQPVPYAGSLTPVRFNWSDEPDRVENFARDLRHACAPKTNSVYEVFAGGVKIGISVAQSPEAALVDATRATTRRTPSKLDTSCDFDNLSVRPLGVRK